MQYSNTILVVDDSAMIVKVLDFMLQKAGYTTLSAEDGEEALTFFDGREIDLVITDLNMPNMDGQSLINEIRQKEYYRYMPIVLFFSGNEEDKKKYLKKSGATVLFDKNDIKNQMLTVIKNITG